jgi:hypothetical protein
LAVELPSCQWRQLQKRGARIHEPFDALSHIKLSTLFVLRTSKLASTLIHLTEKNECVRA